MAGSRTKNFAVIYERTLMDGTVLTFQPLDNRAPAIMIDNEGTSWDIFGNALEGARAGETLKTTASYISYWFAWGAFYPGAEIHTDY